MFTEMRRKDKQLTVVDSLKILTEGEYGVLSTISTDGYPYGIPLNYVYDNNSIYVHSAVEGLKLDNIQKQSRVSFCVVGNTELLCKSFDTNYESVIVFGKAKIVHGEEKEQGLMALVKKYSSDYMEAGKKYIENSGHTTTVVRIEIEHLTGKAQR
ncbi:pyridoxamine 5'-phosphate oxidase family protein [Heliobacterium chlorum]|uniref:Pyridoxamine 5'-phosphate oxidase family protein n=1 Tax=Heliobacterium chlorum TaxID=2698 RepID=A0ABR7T0L0_HELCL|nr:pyridoxamine 5'-phosphate oxidase family protein [Heliobacterium chlorum]MBC9784340.1 pyridoxamine 5'-phosphate oxidase family protein [Heliobacterium chlorum]